MEADYSVTYTVKRTRGPSEAVINSGGKEVARIRPVGKHMFSLETNEGMRLLLDPHVHAEIRPFSLNITAHSEGRTEQVLTIRNHIFKHAGEFYMLTNVPEGMHPADHILGRRYICRLVNFPFSDIADVDHETWGRLRRNRGAVVGEMDGLGLEGHTVRLSSELQDISLPLAASSYLLYSTA